MSYGWVRMEMTVRNRDRRGGHECTELPSLNWAGIATYPMARKLTKKQSRKEMRREHAKLIRDELRYRNADLKADREEELRLIQEEEDAYFMESLEEFEYGRDIDDLYAEDHPGYVDDYYDDYDGYDYYYDPLNYPEQPDPKYAAGYLSKQGLTRLDMNARITEQDAGKPLGELLQEILNKRNSDV